MNSTDQCVRFVPEGSSALAATAAGSDGGETPLLSPSVRPSAAGLKWIDAPTDLSTSGLAYRIHDMRLEQIQVIVFPADQQQGGAAASIKLICSCPLSVPAVHVAASPDGRMVALACADGSLQIYDATAVSLTLRSTIVNCHSHISENLNEPVSKDRSRAAAAAGPIMTLEFCPPPPDKDDKYLLLLVDAHKGMSIWDARLVVTPSNKNNSKNLIRDASKSAGDVSCAAWEDASTGLLDGPHLVVGRFDGSLELFHLGRARDEGNDVDRRRLESVAYLGSPTDDQEGNSFSCTHLNWMPDDTLAAGFCYVTPDDDAESDDEYDDDAAEHDACLYTTTISPDVVESDPPVWDNQGDVVPFFSVPKNGRHVFFTAFVPAESHPLILVASNVASDVGALTKDKKDESQKWRMVELEDGAAATTPTDEDDEFTFPLGISVVQGPSSTVLQLLLAATDGSVSTFKVAHKNEPDYFAAPISEGLIELNNDPVDQLVPYPSPGAEDNGWEVVSDAATTGAANTNAKSASKNDDAKRSIVLGGSVSFGASPISQPFAKPFGAGSATGLSFGSGDSIGGTSAFAAAFTPQGGATSATKTNDSPFAFGKPSTDAKATSNPFGAFSKAPKANDSPFGVGQASTTTASFGAFSAAPKANDSPFSFDQTQTTPAAPANQDSASKPTVTNATVQPSESRPSEITGIGGAERTKASHVFDKFDPTNGGSVPTSCFEEMVEDIGEGFYGDEMSKQLQSIDPSGDGLITRDAFIQWYALLSAEDDDDGSLNSLDKEERAEEEANIKAIFGQLADPTVDGRKYITAGQFGDLMEALGTTFCDETHGKVVSELKKNDGRIYEQDLVSWYITWLFGGDDESAETDPATDNASRELREPKPASPEAIRAGNMFDSFDENNTGSVPVASFEAMSDELGEGFTGDELDKQLAMLDPNNTGVVTREAFVQWYTTFVDEADDGNSLDTEERAERAEEEKNATEEFAKLARIDPGDEGEAYILVDQFKDLIEAFGTTYCEEEHVKTIRRLEHPQGRISQSKFVDWYVEWIFGGDESSEYEMEKDRDSGAAKKDAVQEDKPSLGSIFKIASDTWKCDVCSVQNTDSLNVCVACGTPRPGVSATASNATTAAPSTAKTTSGAGSFIFGAPSTTASRSDSKTAVSLGAASNSITSSDKKTAFSFGIPSTTVSMSKTESSFSVGTPAAASDLDSKTFSFGTPSVTNIPGNKPEAPTPAPGGFSFGAQSTDTSKTSSSPPAPKASSSAVFPPMSAVPPTPFKQTVQKTPAPASASAAFPPMSATAPKTFNEGQKAAATSSAAFPPMATAAPKPFKPAAHTAATPAPQTAAFPPMVATAPTPFSAQRVKAPAAALPDPSNSSAFPPLSAKAPTPFGDLKKESPAPASKASSSSAAFPPMSTKAPKPFGGQKSGAAPDTAPASKASSSSAAFPPSSTKSPKPFGGAGAPASKATSISAAFPPLSAKAPTPFGGFSAPESTASVPSTGPVFPLMASATPTLGIGQMDLQAAKAAQMAPAMSSSSPLGKATQKTAAAVSTQSSSAVRDISRHSQSSHQPMSKVRAQFEAVAQGLQRMNIAVDNMKRKVASETSSLRQDAEVLLNTTQQARLKLLDSDDMNRQSKEQMAFALSRNTDSQRQADEAMGNINAIKTSEASLSNALPRSISLDFESEKARRGTTASAIAVSRQLALAKERIVALETLAQDGNVAALSGQVMDNYIKSKAFKDHTVTRIANKMKDHSRPLKGGSPVGRSRTTYRLEHEKNSVVRKERSSISSVAGWKAIEASLAEVATETSHFQSLSEGRPKQPTPAQSGKLSGSSRTSQSLLLNRATPNSGAGGKALLEPPTQTSIFSPPSNSRPRSGWDRPSSLDTEKMKQLSIQPPANLSQATLLDTSRETLASFNTTPDKLRAAVDASTRLPASQSHLVPSASTAPTSLSSSSASKPPAPPKKPAEVRKGKTSSPFPPMSSKAPKNPFSTSSDSQLKANPPSAPGEEAPWPSATGAKSASRKDGPFNPSNTTLSAISPAPATSIAPHLFSLDGMSGLGSSLTSGLDGKNDDASPVQKTVGETDFKAILTAFYQKHNPQKVADVDRTLEKFKGKEREMFSKLSAKYRVPSPLDSNPPTTKPSPFSVSAATPAASPFSNTAPGATSLTKPSPTTSSSSFPSSSNLASSSLGGGMASSPSPFGRSAPGASPFASSAPSTAPAPSPFGSTTTSIAPSPTPFGGTGPAPAPFGSPAGLSTPSPFGSPPAPAFGAAPAAQTSTAGKLFRGKTARELLVQFYQEKDPSKVASVDKILVKYQNQEESMFRNLAKKYHLDPSLFGVSSAPPAAVGGHSFGSPSGMGMSSVFSPPGGSFGQQSVLGSGGPSVASPGGGHAFGSSASPGFGVGTSFGSLAGGGGAFGGGGATPFGSPTPTPSPFGAPRR